MDKVLKLAMKPRNEGWMELLMNGKLLRKEDMDLALRLASEYKKIELTGQLMDYREQHFPKADGGKLRLDDFDIF